MTPALPAPRRRSVSLQAKLTLVFIGLLITPTLVSWWLVTQIGAVTSGFGRNEATARLTALEGALAAYTELIATKKQACASATKAIATGLPPGAAPSDAAVQNAKLTYPELHALTVLAAQAAAEPSPVSSAAALPVGYRYYDVDAPLGAANVLRARFVVRDWQVEAQQIHVALDQARSATRVRSAMPRSYLIAFWLTVGGAVLLAATIGAFASRRVARRAEAVLATTRAVAQGDMAARSRLLGDDEFAELAEGVDTMLDALQESQRHVTYLQRVNTWQDVARRLAHEIKNPLTPIQLAVQQCVSAYRGDDAAFGKTLHTAQEIVEDEIRSLRRLVDTFRTLGQLPRVQATPMRLALVLDDLSHMPEFSELVTIDRAHDDIIAMADRLMLRRLLANLIDNGMQAGQGHGRAGRVQVSTSLDAGAITCFIDDEGPGVKPGNAAAIFEPYFTTKKSGTGLGLSIAKTIAIDHGGDLVASASPSPLGGARFVVTIPLATAAVPPAPTRGET
ncbi:MAG: HAMP domain-containing protein [Myxococcales bacterium]|nr:HAMP domain-containing protein [Myxococcales bacterium]